MRGNMLKGIIQEVAADSKAFPQLLELSRALKGIISVPGCTRESTRGERIRPAPQEVPVDHDSAPRQEKPNSRRNIFVVGDSRHLRRGCAFAACEPRRRANLGPASRYSAFRSA